MSADNGIYILKTPARPTRDPSGMYEHRNGVFEFRIAVCSNIDNLDYSDLWMPAYFGDSKVFYESSLAWKQADLIEEEYGWTEYGKNLIEKPNVFPNMTSEEAHKALDSYVEKPSSFEPEVGHGGCDCCDLNLKDLRDYE